jgi:hypothetical protein
VGALGAVELLSLSLVQARREVSDLINKSVAGCLTMFAYVLLALLNGGVAVRVGDLGGSAEGGGNRSMNEAQDGDGAQGNGNGGAGGLCQCVDSDRR